MTIVDLLVCCFSLPLAILNMLFHKLVISEQFCSYVGYMTCAYCMFSIVSVGMIAFDRYLSVCHHNVSSKVFTWRNVILSIIALLSLSFVYCFSSKIQHRRANSCNYKFIHVRFIGRLIPGISVFGLVPGRTCCLNFIDPIYTFIFLFFVGTLPAVFSVYFYVKIYAAISASKRRLRQNAGHPSTGATDASKKEGKKETEVSDFIINFSFTRNSAILIL